jgi:CRISPR-associated protein Csb1
MMEEQVKSTIDPVVLGENMKSLRFELLKNAVAGEYAAIRRVARLEPQGGKVFPPTYEGGEYADEARQVEIDGRLQIVETVLLDSVQSQANRLELALLRAYNTGSIKMPMLQVDFAGHGADAILAEIGRITALEAPHRMCDAIFRDAIDKNGRSFRKGGVGEKLNTAKAANATPVFELCPPALLFGFWDSTGPRGGSGTKVQRAIVSEIVGYNKVDGKRSASRIDPLQIENNVEIYEKKGGGWTLDETGAEKDGTGRAIKLKPCEINHGNITPSLRHENRNTGQQVFNHGGVTIGYAVQYTVLSLAALRRLHFPVAGVVTSESDNAARAVLAALGLAAICFLDQDGYDLRSRCLLDGKPGALEFVGRGEMSSFELDAAGAASLLGEAVAEAKLLGLPWPEEPITLRPSPDLSKLVVESRRRSMRVAAGE